MAGLLAVSACGAAGDRATADRAASGSSASRQLAKLGSAAKVRNGVCVEVKAPKPKGPQHIATPTLTLDPAKRYTVQLLTNCGAIDVRLAVRSAPRIAASFVYLVRRGFYNDLTFHRVVAGFVIQAGDPTGNGSGGPGYTIVEPPPADTQYRKGTVAMAKSATDPPGAAGSQFFIVTGSNIDLPPQYALLGTVVGGQKTVAAISEVPTVTGPDGEKSAPAHPIVILQATVRVS